MKALKQFVVVCVLGLAVMQPAKAGVPVVDGAHIGMQLGQWAENLVQWGKQFDEWKKNIKQWSSTFKSQLSAELGKLTDSSNASTRETDMDEIIKQMQASKLCDKVKVEQSKTLCDQEQNLKVARAKRIVKALKDSSDSIKEVNRLVEEYNQLVQSASTSSDGGDSNTNKGSIDSKAKEIDVAQQKVRQAFEEAQKDVQIYDSQISMVRGLRVDMAKIQLEGQEPGLIDKLAVTAGVGGTLTAAAKKYKRDIEMIKIKSDTNNNY
ncbi:MAG: hypothetical protein ACRCV6_10975 [Formosimonas sp.]